MDEIDIEIMRLLQEDARKPLSEISSKINLSLPAISERLKKLERSGAIKEFTVILDNKKFGKSLCSMCLISLKSKSDEDSIHFLEYIAQEPDILECHRITGEYDYFIKILTNSIESLDALLKAIRNDALTIRTNSFVVLSTVKEKHSINPIGSKKA